jgi:hypothetical protein
VLRRFSLFLCIFILCASETHAQDGEILSYGSIVTGNINNLTPRAIYTFDGLRGEVISISLRVTSGDLDPVLMLIDAQGEIVVTLDDSQGTRAPLLPAMRIPDSERYSVIVGRFGYEFGTTSGNYELEMQRVGVSSASGTMLRYGDQIINSINDMNPQLYYSFRANQGDIVDVRMRRVSGDLDAYLQVVNSNAVVLADNDDTPGQTMPFDAQVTGLVIEETGTYVIIASRYGQAAGTSVGNFVLILEEADNSGLGNSPLTARPMQPGESIDGSLTESRFTQYYTFQAQKDDLVSVRMTRTNGLLDSLVAIADIDLQELVVDDDSAGGQNAQISQFKIPEDGTYYIVATRFDREAGTTAGSYTLELVDLGNAFDGIPEDTPRIGYGSTVTGVINETTLEAVYAFYGEQGDIITVSMSNADGDLDPVVSILDDQQRQIAIDDDSGSGQNASIARFEIPASGTYYVRATRYSGDPPGNPNTTGTYNLTLARRFN